MTTMMRKLGVLATIVFALASSVSGHAQDPGFENYRVYRHSAVRLWQNYQLPATDGVRDVVVVGGTAAIDGHVYGEVHVILGDVRLGSTAVIDDTLFVVGGDIYIAEGAVIRRNLGVVGGVIHAPPAFTPGGGHFVFGAESLGRTLRALAPWFTHGLLWGRLIVPSIGWVWFVVFTMLVVTLALNLLLHNPVGACAATLSARPFSAFMTGLLVLLLAGPLSALMALSIIGVAVVPFLLCAVVVAWIVGKVGVLRWIGATLVPSDEDSRLVAMRAVLIGFVAISLMYMVPLLGIVTWAMVGVFGLGAATQAFLGALRRERPVRKSKVAPPPSAPPPPTSAPYESAAAFAAPVYEPPLSYEPPRSSEPPRSFEPPLSYEPARSADLRGFPRAQFVDRLAAAALDAVLLVMFYRMVRFGYGGDEGRFFFALLYFVVFWAWKGTTLGGIVCNLRITRVDGAPLQFADALVRGLAGIFSIGALGLGFLWILRDPEKQAWHDRIAGTFVVKVPRDWPLP